MNTSRAAAELALEIGAAAATLKAGRALDATRRTDLFDLLMRAAMALMGRPAPRRAYADPAGLVEAAVLAARDAGMAPADVVTVVNDALTAANGPARSLRIAQ